MKNMREMRLLSLIYREMDISNLNSAYEEFIKMGCFDELEDILKEIGKTKNAKYYCSTTSLENVEYSKIIYMGKLYILFPWTDQGKIVLVKKYIRNEKADVSKEENTELDVILKNVEAMFKEKIEKKRQKPYFFKYLFDRIDRMLNNYADCWLYCRYHKT